ncbi:hypothetical protein [Halostagnicola sp. A56]|uniref:hypothetical protein n=1 Tax=Halostagnicola sp. A56 TaxID=1495067 RepID=UPI0012E2C6A2|nr:hypothetical protein [Halostagnicola sp. A56]
MINRPFAVVSLSKNGETIAPGEEISQTLRFANYSPTAIDRAYVTFNSPNGWESEPATATFNNIAAGPAVLGASDSQNVAETDWIVRPPIDAMSKKRELGVTVEYGDSISIEEQFTINVE